jgi:hypothetical protein
MSDHFYVTLLSNASQKLYPENTIGAFTAELARPIDLSSDGNWEVGLCDFTCPSDTVGTIYNRTVVGDHIALIYCDVVSPQFVGGNLVRCLRTYIYPSLTCQYEFKNVYYMPVEKRRITNIRIEILTTSGNKVAFKSGKQPSKLVLHFRKCDINRSYNHSHSTFGDYESPGTILPPSGRSRK